MTDNSRHEDLVCVATVQGEVPAQVIRSMLEGSGIDSMLQGEAVRLTHGLTVDGLGEVKVMVRAEDEETARELIAMMQDPENE
jgi:hypothetical protein